MMNKIEARKLKKKYDNFSLNDISFSIPKGYITGLIGKNGMGKTTTIKCILSLNKYNGEIFYDGNKIKDLGYLQDVGVIMSDSFLAKDWTLTLVNKAMKVGYDNWNEDTYFSYLKRFDLNKSLKVQELSRGMKIKLMLSIALSHKANTLILDEPTSGLDPSMRDEFTDIIKDFISIDGNTVVYSTHITQDLDRIADYIIFIDDGNIIFNGPMEDFLDMYVVVKGGEEDLDLIKGLNIIGFKKTSLYFEALVEKKNLHNIDDKLVFENPDIEKIMVLYGRKNNGEY